MPLVLKLRMDSLSDENGVVVGAASAVLDKKHWRQARPLSCAWKMMI